MSHAIERTAFHALRRRLPLAMWPRSTKLRAPRLDAESLSEELKRDLGLLDGRISGRRDPLRD